jgi:CRISPR-associated protein Csy1
VEIAHRDPESVLVFFAGAEDGARRAFRERLQHAFAAAGIAPEQHVLFLPTRARADYLRVNLACDVMLDSLHWSGGNTSLDALHAGLPVVTCPGRFMRGRQSMAMLRHLDCTELVAETPHQLAKLAIDVAHDRARRTALAARIRLHLPAFTQSEAPLAALDAVLRGLLAEP